jgi:predicted nucleic acid-binding protein
VSGFDFDAALRWARFDPKRTLARRSEAALPMLAGEMIAGSGLLLDTCVYIDQLQGRAPGGVDELLSIRQVNHSTIAVQELMHGVGILDPRHPGTTTAIRQIGKMIKAMPGHRVLAPDADTQGRAAMVAGILCRIQGYARDDKMRALHDCALFLQAQKLGLTVLTRNIADFDYLLQMFATARVLPYQPQTGST